MRHLVLLAAATLLSVAGGTISPGTAAAQVSALWEIGPVIRNRNYSAGMPSSPIPSRSGWTFEFPYPDPRAGHVHYVTAPTGSLAGKTRIVVRYRIDAAPGVVLSPQEAPGAPATLALYFQRRGDNWSSRGPFEHFRWYATHANRKQLTPGEHEISLDLNGRNWKSLRSATGADVPEQFAAALADAGRVGFVFGGGAAAGHGVFASGPARFELLDFRVI